MSRTQHRRKASPISITAYVAVVLLLAGIAAVIASIQMQAKQIEQGAEEYAELAELLKVPAHSEQDANETVTAAGETVQNVLSEALSADISAIVSIQNAQSATPPDGILDMTCAPTLVPYESSNPSGSSTITGADLSYCKAVNGDFIGWLQIPGTKVDYPVVLSDNVDYYLKHSFARKENIIGCLFSLGKTDYRTPGKNIAVYGHHMRRSRAITMFQPLHEYKSSKFRSRHSSIYFDTLYGFRSYTVFAVINKRESDWDAAACDFSSDDDFQAFIDRAMEWSLYDTGIRVSADDNILTLITCDRDYHSEDGQLVVMAVQD